jgi:hypothetical protein
VALTYLLARVYQTTPVLMLVLSGVVVLPSSARC